MDPFKDRVAVITGAAGGIGSALARAFAERGARLVLADLDESGLERVAKELEARGSEVLTVRTDVSQRESVEALAEASWRCFGAAHLVCNNAGVATFGELAQATHEDWVFTMSVNFWGVVHGVESFVPRLIAQGDGGHVVNTASMAGLAGMQWLGVYSASKFAIVGLTEALRRELEPRGIGVSVLAPMMVDTQMTGNTMRVRPAELRSQDETPGPGPDSFVGNIISAEEVAARAVRGIERNDLYILTHPEQREILRRRAARLDAVFGNDVWPLTE